MTHQRTIDLPSSAHKQNKKGASMSGTTIKNKVTQKTLKMSERGQGLKRFESLEEMFKDLGI
jgi:hypothetical protein